MVAVLTARNSDKCPRPGDLAPEEGRDLARRAHRQHLGDTICLADVAEVDRRLEGKGESETHGFVCDTDMSTHHLVDDAAGAVEGAPGLSSGEEDRCLRGSVDSSLLHVVAARPATTRSQVLASFAGVAA